MKTSPVSDSNPFQSPQDAELDELVDGIHVRLRSRYLRRETTLRGLGLALLVYAFAEVWMVYLSVPNEVGDAVLHSDALQRIPGLAFVLVGLALTRAFLGLGLMTLRYMARVLLGFACSVRLFYGFSLLGRGLDQAGSDHHAALLLIMTGLMAVVFNVVLLYLLLSTPSRDICRSRYRQIVRSTPQAAIARPVILKAAMLILMLHLMHAALFRGLDLVVP